MNAVARAQLAFQKLTKHSIQPEPVFNNMGQQIGAEPTTNCNSYETYVILFQIYPCITY